MNQRFPEPTFPPSATNDEIRWALARRSVYLELRDAYALARKRAS